MCMASSYPFSCTQGQSSRVALFVDSSASHQACSRLSRLNKGFRSLPLCLLGCLLLGLGLWARSPASSEAKTSSHLVLEPHNQLLDHLLDLLKSSNAPQDCVEIIRRLRPSSLDLHAHALPAPKEVGCSGSLPSTAAEAQESAAVCSSLQQSAILQQQSNAVLLVCNGTAPPSAGIERLEPSGFVTSRCFRRDFSLETSV